MKMLMDKWKARSMRISLSLSHLLRAVGRFLFKLCDNCSVPTAGNITKLDAFYGNEKRFSLFSRNES